jgi:two-component system sensor histidine kinase EvgS
MPIMDGFDSSRKIREYEAISNLKTTPALALIIGLSGNSGDSFTRKCKAAGMSDCLTKPVAIDMLSKVVDRAFGGGGGVVNHVNSMI